MARERGSEKGVRGWKKHPVVAISPDGKAKHFDSVSAVKRFLQYPKESQAVGYAIKRQFPVRGYRIIYEEDWSPLGDYSFRLPCDRDFDGHPTSVMRRQIALRKWRNMSEEKKQKVREWGREHVRKLRAEGKLRSGNKPVPVYCSTLNKFFPTVTEAAKEIGTSASNLCKAIRTNRPVHGLKFYRKSVWDKITQKKL